MHSRQPSPVLTDFSTESIGNNLNLVPDAQHSNLLGTFRERPKKSRRKLWDIPHKYHCPIIGTCLHIDELRRLVQKHRYNPDQQPSDYDLHVSFVTVANKKSFLSVATQKLLDKKHAVTIKQFAKAKDGKHLHHLWQDAVAKGQVPGAFWALMSHPKIDHSLEVLAFEQVHMLSHQVGAGLITDTKLLTEARTELNRVHQEAQRETRRTTARLTERNQRITTLEERLVQLQDVSTRLTEAHQRIKQLESDKWLTQLRERLEQAENELVNLRRFKAHAKNETARWREQYEANQVELKQTKAKLEEYRLSCSALEQLLVNEDSECKSCLSGEENPVRINLDGRRILFVGGRNSLTGHYRSIVYRCNGKFVHHDGGIEDNRHRLETLLTTADVVVCPANCVSHNAYLCAKRYCKRTAKPCVLIKSAGVSSFVQALEQVTT